VDLTPPDLHKDKREIQYKERKKMGKKSKERRVYMKEFKVEAAAANLEYTFKTGTLFNLKNSRKASII